MAQVIGAMCSQLNLAFSLEEATIFGWGSSPGILAEKVVLGVFLLYKR
jgi:hypothetical protein